LAQLITPIFQICSQTSTLRRIRKRLLSAQNHPPQKRKHVKRCDEFA